MKISLSSFSAIFLLVVAGACAAPQSEHPTWTDPTEAVRDDPDFAIQGEYRSSAMGAQVVALGGGNFDIHIFDGGLPGAGWEKGKSRILLKGKRTDGRVDAADSAGHANARIEKQILYLTDKIGAKHQLLHVQRESPTLGAKPPIGAVILFDGTSTAAWEKGIMENGYLLASGSTSKQRFGDYKLHLEFRTPYKPSARGQQRGNSGIYHSGRWETQILDSFGLDGKDNECGGIYSVSKPLLNMCFPPLSWQTYDVSFKAATFDASGKRLTWPRITVQLNGVTVHEDLELAKNFTTSAPITKPLAGPEGPIFLQEHGNPVVFRNIWIVPGK